MCYISRHSLEPHFSDLAKQTILVPKNTQSRKPMHLLKSLLNKLGFGVTEVKRNPIRVFLLDDDLRRHSWFRSRFAGDLVDVASDVSEAQALLSANSYDAIFLDHDLQPEHYNSTTPDDARTGYAIALWLASNPQLQSGSSILVHTRNADGAMRMVEKLRQANRNAEYVPFPFLPDRIKHYWKR